MVLIINSHWMLHCTGLHLTRQPWTNYWQHFQNSRFWPEVVSLSLELSIYLYILLLLLSSGKNFFALVTFLAQVTCVTCDTLVWCSRLEAKAIADLRVSDGYIYRSFWGPGRLQYCSAGLWWSRSTTTASSPLESNRPRPLWAYMYPDRVWRGGCVKRLARFDSHLGHR